MISSGQHLRTSRLDMIIKHTNATHRLTAVASAEPTNPNPFQVPNPNKKIAFKAMFNTKAMMHERIAGITIRRPTNQLLKTSNVALGTMPSSLYLPNVFANSKSILELARLFVIVPAYAHTGEHITARNTETATPI
jgi:hypothetical protein